MLAPIVLVLYIAVGHSAEGTITSLNGNPIKVLKMRKMEGPSTIPFPLIFTHAPVHVNAT